MYAKLIRSKPHRHVNGAIFMLLISIGLGCLIPLAEANGLTLKMDRPRIGLVLGGGGARGAAHVGVLKVLEENRIPIDYIVGTSMGAIVGGLYASGASPQEIEEMLKSADWKDLFTDRPSRKDLSFRRKHARRQLIDFEMGLKKGKLVLPRGLIAGQKISFFLKSKTLHTAGVGHFNELSIPFRAIAADLENGKMVVLDKGNLAEAIRASMSVPGVFSPVEIDGRILVDGGIVENLPVDIARGLGAEVIIAVDVSTPLLRRENLKSLVDVTMQVIGIMTSQNVNEQIGKLSDKDVLITPELGDISSQDFSKAREAAELGETAARQFREGLSRYSVSKEEYRAFLVSQRRNAMKPIRIDAVKINPPERVSQLRIERRLETKAGSDLELKTLKASLTKVYAIGDFEQVDFKFLEEEKEKREGGKTLLIDTQEKSWGPNYLHFGLNITDNFRGDSFYNFITEYTATQLNDRGAEWKNELQVGRTRKFFSEFYQPLDYGERFFVAPKFKYERSVIDVFSDDTRLAQYKVGLLEGGFDLGINLGTYAEGRFGITRGHIDAGPIVGDSSLPRFDINQAAMVGTFTFDQIDDSNFPRYGIAADTSIFMAREGLGADRTYDKFEFSAHKATTIERHTILAGIMGGMDLGKEIPFYDEFTLGGFLSLSGYRKGELRGKEAGLGRLIYYYEITKASIGWADGIYVGGSFEGGNIWNKRSDIAVDDLIFGGSVFVGLDTIFGPLYLGYGLAEKRTDGEIYLFLGQTF